MLKVFGIVIAATSYTVGQIANCSATGATYDWSFNSLKQDPCVIASYLGGACNAAGVTVQPLDPDGVYIGPRKDAANSCRCSSVFYSLISVCSLCQERKYLHWSQYNENCTTISVGVFIPDIPSGTSVPHYAYLNVTNSDNFDPEAAQAAIDAPESTRSSQISTGAPPTPSTNSSSNSSSSKAGPIAGGVVGGVVFVALLAATAIWWARRYNTRTINPRQSVTNYRNHDTPTPMSFNSGPTSVSPFVGLPSLSPKLYDPSDPSTYPSTPATSAVFTTQEHQPFLHTSTSLGTPYHSQTNPQGRTYTGAPEI
ncbi:hypothetical protein BDZ94DRAFT_1303706 [Collybia nuda]|uniref:Transmembrane protein n=1 Tax=Collybia nuda TaxID=64659 RepID=A0A9P6CJU9_9AGAR|nr:hypothetical protein BDZ94DRAFT_1303706 [Collybia nuda]